ncbi:MAG TPA: hypothetical protein PLD37_11455, partial [Usitatibacteraceae bacterium]|nr:hypothetical protein [Usitatibacteraceae bacterium]
PDQQFDEGLAAFTHLACRQAASRDVEEGAEVIEDGRVLLDPEDERDASPRRDRSFVECTDGTGDLLAQRLDPEQPPGGRLAGRERPGAP